MYLRLEELRPSQYGYFNHKNLVKSEEIIAMKRYCGDMNLVDTEVSLLKWWGDCWNRNQNKWMYLETRSSIETTCNLEMVLDLMLDGIGGYLPLMLH